MRLFTLVLLGLLLATASVFAQEKNRQEFSLGIGTASHPFLKERGLLETAKEGAGSQTGKTIGALQVGYRWYSAKRWDLGATLVSESQRFKRTSSMPDAQGLYKSYTDRHMSVIASVNYHWLQRSTVSLYSGAGAGVNFQRRKETHNDFSTAKDEFSKTNLSWQGTALGLRAGGNLGGFIELGYGYKGILSAGLSASF